MFTLPRTPVFGIRFALIVSIILTIIKGIIWFLSGSLAILGSALDSLMDMFVSGVNALALHLSEKARSRNYTYGLGKVQGFAAIFEWLVVFSSGLFLSYSGVINYLSHKSPTIETIEIITMIIAMAGTALIMWNFLRIQKVSNSLLIKSDTLHYASDLFMNGGILIALMGSKFLGLWWCDAIFAVGIGLWIIKNSLPIIKNGISMLLDHSLDLKSVKKIQSLIRSEKNLESYHYLKTRKSGDDVFIEAHIVFRDKKILLAEAHTISDHLEEKILEYFPGATILLHPDIDGTPEGQNKK